MREGIHDSSSLFDLQNLQSLKFADSRYYDSQIPSAIGKLANLRYLNLSRNGFWRQIPIGISHLIKLTVLDLSENYLELKNPNLSMLVQNLTELQELYFDYVNLSAEKGGEWCKVISSSLPHLRALSLYSTSLSGPIDRSLAKLTSLSVIRLDYTHLFSGVLPDSIGNLKILSETDIPKCHYQLGSYRSMMEFPKWMANLTYLYDLQMSENKFSDSISSPHWENLVNLAFVDLSPNLFDGGIALSMFSLPLLQALDLSNNEFSHQLHEFSNVSSLVDTQVNDTVSP